MKRAHSAIVRVFFAAATLLVGSILLIYLVGLAAIASNRKVADERSILRHLEQTISTLKDAETGQRGYLLTGNETYLGPYHQAVAQIHTEEETLRRLASAGDLPSQSVETVIRLAEEKLAVLEQTVQLRRDSGLEPALAIVRAGQGKAIMDKIRAEVASMDAAKTIELEQARKRADNADAVRNVTFFLMVSFNLVFGGWAYRRIFREILAREAALLEVRLQKEWFGTTLDSIGDGVIATDAEGRVTFLNGEAERLTGWKSSDAAGQSLPAVFRIVNEATRQPVENPVEKVVRLGNVVALANHTILLARDGREIPIDDSAAPIRQPGGPLAGVVLVFRDFTQQRKAQDASARLAAIVEFSDDAIFTKNLDGVIQTWNSGAERLFGYRAEEIIGKPITVLFPPGRLDEEVHILESLRQGLAARRLETTRVAKDGRHIPVAVHISPLKDADGRVTGASKIVHDITDLVASREALAREKELLATTLASIGDGVVVTDAQGRVNFLNAEAERLTGWKSQEAAGEPLPSVFHIINEHTRQLAENPVDKVLRLGTVVGLANHTLLLRRDGTEVPIDDSAAPIRQSNGPLFGVVLVFRDFTEHKQAEEKLEKTVEERTAKLREMVSELQHVSYAMVHDMRAPLRAMQAFAQILANESSEETPEQRQDHLRRIMTAASRLDKLVQDALGYNKAVLQEVPLQPVELTPLLRGLVDTYPNLAPANADIRVEGELPVVRGNEALLAQCFSNLLGNAVKFVAAGVRPQVTVRAESRDGRARIWVADNGIGIPERAQKRLFGMFQKLDSEYEGTGIGLAIVRKVTERMGGKVGAESEPGRGSRFWVELQTVSA